MESVEANKNYSCLLIELIRKENIDLTIRVAGAITFKNFVKRNWAVDNTVRFSLFYCLYIIDKVVDF